MVLDWYLQLLNSDDQNWIKKYLKLKTITEVKEFNLYRNVQNYWKKIRDIFIPPDVQFLISYLFNMYGEYDKLEFLYKKYNSIETLGPLLNILRLKRGLIKAQTYIAETDLASVSKSSIFPRFYFYNSEIKIFATTFNNELASQLISQCKLLLNKCEGQLFLFLQANLFYTLGFTVFRYREPDKAIFYFSEAKKILENIEKTDEFLLAVTYNTLGNAYMFKGLLKQSKSNYYKSFNLFNEMNNNRGKIVTEGNIASLDIKLGKHKEALPKLIKIKEFFSENNELRNVALINREIMQCLIEIGKTEKAVEYLKENIKLLETRLVYDDEVLISSIEFAIQIQKFDIVEKLLKTFENIILKDKENISFHNGAFYSLKGYYELIRGNLYNASIFLEKGIEIAKSIKNYPLYLTGLKYHSIYLIKKLQIQYSEEIISELEEICEEISLILRKHSNIYLKIDFQLLLARIYALQEKFDLANHIYSLTVELCKNYNMNTQLKEILREMQTLKKMEQNPEKLDDKALQIFSLNSITKTLQKPSTEIRNIEVNLNLYNKDHLINLIIIHFNGLPLYSHQFKGEKIEEKQLLLSGLFKAIESFSDTLTKKHGIFKLIEFTDFIIMIEKRKKYSVVLFIDEFYYSVKERLIQFANKIESLLQQTEVLQIDYFTNKILTPIKQEIDNLRIEIFEK
ncbi:MAG: hypothetical protein ACTSRR_08310 [Candidatus Heimdallarchaeaceae archaeon]